MQSEVGLLLSARTNKNHPKVEKIYSPQAQQGMTRQGTLDENMAQEREHNWVGKRGRTGGANQNN